MASTLALPLLAALALTAVPARAADLALSGFGSAGYARSDQPYDYQRFISEDGTVKRDSILGLQLDAKFTPQWGATVQATLAPSASSDSGWSAKPSWAFLSYRPSNDWLLRAGKLRVPLYLNSENMDVGATFDYARLPAEMYSIAPTTDFTGASFSKSWSGDAGDLALDGYWGRANMDWRFHMRDGVPGQIPAGPLYTSVKTEAKGLVLTLQRGESRYRAGYHVTDTKRADGAPLAQTFPFVELVPHSGIGMYLAAGPGVPTIERVKATVFSAGADVALEHDVRLVGEVFRRRVQDMQIGPDSKGGYLSALKKVGAWTPYATYARLLSSAPVRQLYQAVNQNSVPGFLPGAPVINASQRAAADGIPAYDQYSIALGTSYALSPTSKIKAELLHVHIGDMSSMIDPPSGGAGVRDQNIRVLSLSYSFVF
ncbi:MAG: hypothetical protein H7Z39_16675 [Burkholderiaceae bacterium]|nr:hypothetical protein [Burkholderiaceae bacterium]